MGVPPVRYLRAVFLLGGEFLRGQRRERSNESGFTLVEVMVAAVILTAALMTLVSVINWGVQLSQEAQSRTVAMGLAMQQLERIKAQYPQQPNDFVTNATLAGIIQSQTTTQTIEANLSKAFTTSTSYTSQATYTTQNKAYTFCDMRVTVKVSWQDNTAGVTRQVALTTELVGR